MGSMSDVYDAMESLWDDYQCYGEPDHEAKESLPLDERIGKVELPLPLIRLQYTGKLLTLLRDAAGCGKLKTDVDEITIAVVEGKAGLIVMAMDAQDFDSLAHLPILSLTWKVPYFFVPSTENLPAASGESRSVCCVMKGSISMGCLIQDLDLRLWTTLTVKSGDERAIEPPPLKKHKLDSTREPVGETPDLAGKSIEVFNPVVTKEKKRREEKVDLESLRDKIKVPVLLGMDDSTATAALVMVRYAAYNRAVEKGIAEVTKALCMGSSEFVVMAADAQHLNRMLHLPILAKAKNVSYIFVPDSLELTANCYGSKTVSACCVNSYKHADLLKKWVLDLQSDDSKEAIEAPVNTSPYATPDQQLITGCAWCLNTYSEDKLAIHKSACPAKDEWVLQLRKRLEALVKMIPFATPQSTTDCAWCHNTFASEFGLAIHVHDCPDKDEWMLRKGPELELLRARYPREIVCAGKREWVLRKRPEL